MKIKVMSLNIWHGGYLWDTAVEFIKAENADILLLQEAYDGHDLHTERRFRMMDEFKSILGYEYSDFAKVMNYVTPEGSFPHGNAIFTKFPIKSSSFSYFTEPQPGRDEYDDIPENWSILPSKLQHVELETPTGPLDVFNMHGVWDLDGDNYSQNRQKMRDIILRDTADKKNVIVAGDSNAKASNQAMRELEPQLKSVFGQELKSTFNMRRKDNPGYATAAVDLMFVSPNIKVLDKSCPDVDVSDHLPIIATLEID
jgi:endonuclease/exonuclease/phosphatase family metal-dependent hydrolase